MANSSPKIEGQIQVQSPLFKAKAEPINTTNSIETSKYFYFVISPLRLDIR